MTREKTTDLANLICFDPVFIYLAACSQLIHFNSFKFSSLNWNWNWIKLNCGHQLTNYLSWRLKLWSAVFILAIHEISIKLNWNWNECNQNQPISSSTGAPIHSNLISFNQINPMKLSEIDLLMKLQFDEWRQAK